jgi:spore coat-associated protein N
MKKILLSIGMIVAVAAGVAGATGAFFSDTETSTGNTFTAGAIDLKVSATSTYSNAEGVVASSTWALKDLDVVSDKFFNFGDVKPGDTGTTVIGLNVINNDAYLCAQVSGLTNDDNSQTEPEGKVDANGLTTGELQSEMRWTIWNDVNHDGVQDSGETVLVNNANPANGVWTLHDATNGALVAGATDYLGVTWTLPGTSDNRTQTDSMTGDISFHVEQSRNNEGFKCSSVLPN